MKPPAAPRENTVETWHGVFVPDPFRWLEDKTSPQSQAWVSAMTAWSQASLAALDEREPFRRRLAGLREMSERTLPVGIDAVWLFTERTPADQQARLMARIRSVLTLVEDPNRFGPDDPHHIDWATVSPDGRWIFYGMSRHGDEWSTLYAYDTETRAVQPETIPRARFSTVGAPPGGNGFYYTAYPPHTVHGKTVYWHGWGTAVEDDPIIFQPDNPLASPRVLLSPDGKRLVIHVAYGWTRDVVWMRSEEQADSRWECLWDRGESRCQPFWGPDGRLWALTTDEAGSEAVQRYDGHRWTSVIGEIARQPILHAVVTRQWLYLHRLVDARSQLERRDPETGRLLDATMMAEGTHIRGMEAVGSTLYYEVTGFFLPPRIERKYDSDRRATLWHAPRSPISSMKVTRTEATAPDGTTIPVIVAHPADWKPGSDPRPLVLNGYGGFNVAYLPVYSPAIEAWVDNGGLYALALIRGGGEFGDAWHRDGMRAQKQKGFDDFYHAAHHLIQSQFTTPRQLGVLGRSNGGLLAGAFLTQHPDTARAVVMGVPLLDMIHFPRFLIGGLWTTEYGSPDIPEEFQWLYAYSPYHHVQDHTPYPAVLLFTSEEDGRVDPVHAFKMAARLIEATASDQPVFLRLAPKTGHGAGKSLDVWLDEESDIWAFFAHYLGNA